MRFGLWLSALEEGSSDLPWIGCVRRHSHSSMQYLDKILSRERTDWSGAKGPVGQEAADTHGNWGRDFHRCCGLGCVHSLSGFRHYRVVLLLSGSIIVTELPCLVLASCVIMFSRTPRPTLVLQPLPDQLLATPWPS